jgi:hypothetical protein
VAKETPAGGLMLPPIIQGEQIFLSQMMVNGEPVSYPYEFTDHRHKVICRELGHLQTVSFRPGVNELVRHLTECRNIIHEGGSRYVREIFRGAIPSRRGFHG